MEDFGTFMQAYEQATNSHDFNRLAPFIAINAIYWFSDGSYEGIDAIQAAIEATWKSIKDEVYTISQVRLIAVSQTTAVCVYTFAWQGIVNGQPKSGQGRGTNVLEKHGRAWQIVHEHLSKQV